MKKGKIFKCIISTLAFIISFFMLSNGVVSAQETATTKVYLSLLEDGNSNYSIVGGGLSCGEFDVCVEVDYKEGEFVIPDTHNDKKIVSIADSASGDEAYSTVGVLDNLKSVLKGKVVIGENMETIGIHAFYGFSYVKEIQLSSGVTLIKDYAFASSGVETLVISRYSTQDQVKTTMIESKNAFSLTTSLKRVVFPSYSVANYYKTLDGYKDLDVSIKNKFTHVVKYVYHKDSNECSTDTENCIYVNYYNGETIDYMPQNLEKTGFDFLGWFNNIGVEAKINSVVLTEGSILEFKPKWELSDPTSSSINTYFENQIDNDKLMVYQGVGKTLDIIVDVDHVLESSDGYSISYKWVKNGSVDTYLEETSNKYSLEQVGQSGAYTCYVTITYSDGNKNYEKIVSLSIIATITPRKLVINVNGNEAVYGEYVGAKVGSDGNYYVSDSVLAPGQIIKSEGVSAPVYTNNNSDLKVGNHGQVLELMISNIGYEDSDVNYIGNYQIEYNKGLLTVVAKEISVKLDSDIELVYGDEENLYFTQTDTVYGNISKELIVQYNRKNPDVNDVGEYEILSITVSDENYIAKLDMSGAGKVVINPKQVEVDWVIDENLIYDGEEKNVSASYVDINDNEKSLNIAVSKGDAESKLINAGEYTLTASMKGIVNKNYVLTNFTQTITIEKAESYFDGEETQSVYYNGKAQSVKVSLNHNERPIQYSGYESCINAHTSIQKACIVTVSVAASENYKAKSESFFLYIKPVTLEVNPSVFEIQYGIGLGADNLTKVYDGVNGEKVKVRFTKKGSSTNLDVGYYDIASAHTADGNTNYDIIMKASDGVNKIKIVKAPITIKFLNFNNSMVYDGKDKGTNINIKYEGTSEDVGLEVNYNGKNVIKNAGSYRISVSISNSNYYISGKDYYEFEILKADYDISSLKLKDKEVRFNFKSHTIKLEGTLPEGVSVNYTIDDNKGNGTSLPFSHTVKVTFNGDFDNYNYIEPITATLYINMTWVFVTLGIILGLIIAAIVTLIVLIKYNVITLTNKVQRRRLRRVVRNNKAIIAINEMFKNNRLLLEQKEVKEDEEVILEDDIKFVKNPVNVPAEAVATLSFVDKLFRSELKTKEYYSEVKNELLSYEGIVSKIKRDYETFYVNNIPVAKFDIKDGILQVCLALDPTLYKKEEYNHKNASKEKDFVAVPLKLMVDSIDSLRHAKMFVRIIRKREKLKSASNFIRTDYVKVYTAKDNSLKLFKKARVKKGSKESLED